MGRRVRYYFACHEEYDKGAMIRRGTDDNDACLLATENLDQAIFLGGFGHVYEVAGKRCRHRLPMYVSFSRQTVFGGYVERFLDGSELPPLGHQFDELTVRRRVPDDEVFGPNGAQVVHVIKWLRSKFELKGEEFILVPSFESPLANIRRYYRHRVTALGWPLMQVQQAILPQFEYKTIAENAAKASWRFWLQPWTFTAAWAAAFEAALRADRAFRCQWLSIGVPALVALCLRDVLEPRHFRSIWDGLEPYFPLEALDSEVKGAHYEA